MFELEKLFSLKGAVSSSCSTVIGIRAAEPVGPRATASRTRSLIRVTLFDLSHLHQLGFPGLKGAVKGSGSTDGNIITAEPMGFGAAASRAVGPTRTLVSFAHLHQLGRPGLKGAVSGSGSTEGAAVRAAVPIRHWAAASRAVGLIRAALLTPDDQMGVFGFNLESTGECHKSKIHSKDLHL